MIPNSTMMIIGWRVILGAIMTIRSRRSIESMTTEMTLKIRGSLFDRSGICERNGKKRIKETMIQSRGYQEPPSNS